MQYPHPIPRMIQVSFVTLSLVFLLIPRSHGSSISPTTTTTTTIPTSSVSEQTTLRKWRLEQSHYYTLRSTYLTELFNARLLSPSSAKSTSTNLLPPAGSLSFTPTLQSVSTLDGTTLARPTDYTCELSTVTNPKTCLYSFDAQPGTKVVAPFGTTHFISLGALNRLRRTDVTKVEPMWHSKYTILQSWFGSSSTSLLSHVGLRGYLVSHWLLDTRWVLKLGLGLGLVVVLVGTLPVWEWLVNKLVCSQLFWDKWMTWTRIANSALPFKLLIAQVSWKFLAGKFGTLESHIREQIVDYECQILEDCVPLTVTEPDDDDEDEDVDTDTEEEDVDDDDAMEDSEELEFDSLDETEME